MNNKCRSQKFEESIYEISDEEGKVKKSD